MVERRAGLHVYRETVVACVVTGPGGAIAAKKARTFGPRRRDCRDGGTGWTPRIGNASYAA
jgi:hypothetical protein